MTEPQILTADLAGISGSILMTNISIGSTKKSSGYTRIATTANSAFVDKKVKKGRRYFYKVRAVRTGNGTIYGAFIAPKQSGKVR